MKYDVFLSYRRRNGTYQATALKEALENRGHKDRVFMDTYTRKGGPFLSELNEALKESCNLVVIISSKDCFNPKIGEEDYYLREIADALEQGKNIVPVYYDGITYEDIELALKNSPYKLENFPKHQVVFYHADNPSGSLSQILSLLKSEEEMLNLQFKSVSKIRKKLLHDIIYLRQDYLGKCPICQSDYDITDSYCKKCAYKFFDELEKSAAEKTELIQEKSREKKHRDIWNRSQQDTTRDKDFEKELELLRDKVKKLESQIESKKMELVNRELQLKASEKYRKQLELQLSGITDEHTHQEKESVFEIKLDEDVKFKMIYVEGGTFMMGANEGDSKAFEWVKPAHQVKLSSYYIGETAVTQALWEAVMGNNPSHFKGADRPVEQVSWNDCQEFIRKLNEKTNRKFRLPTEAEWEFATRGGNKGKYNNYKYAGSNIIDNVAWYEGNSKNETQPVAQKLPNELGLYDMTGNVWEWCQDWYGNYSNNSQTNPMGPKGGDYRVLRGGSWYYFAMGCRTSYRTFNMPSDCDYNIGLRLAL